MSIVFFCNIMYYKNKFSVKKGKIMSRKNKTMFIPNKKLLKSKKINKRSNIDWNDVSWNDIVDFVKYITEKGTYAIGDLIGYTPAAQHKSGVSYKDYFSSWDKNGKLNPNNNHLRLLPRYNRQDWPVETRTETEFPREGLNSNRRWNQDLQRYTYPSLTGYSRHTRYRRNANGENVPAPTWDTPWDRLYGQILDDHLPIGEGGMVHPFPYDELRVAENIFSPMDDIERNLTQIPRIRDYDEQTHGMFSDPDFMQMWYKRELSPASYEYWNKQKNIGLTNRDAKWNDAQPIKGAISTGLGVGTGLGAGLAAYAYEPKNNEQQPSIKKGDKRNMSYTDNQFNKHVSGKPQPLKYAAPFKNKYSK